MSLLYLLFHEIIALLIALATACTLKGIGKGPVDFRTDERQSETVTNSPFQNPGARSKP
jgi:hypothetical protein